MIKIVKGNLLDATEDIIAHQVNCCGVMGAGVAKQIRENFPGAYRHYREECDSAHFEEELLGECMLLWCSCKYDPDCYKGIANLFGQVFYGGGKAHTNEEALRYALKSLAVQLYRYHIVTERPLKNIAMPYKIGCGLAGGNWDNIYKIIEEELADFNVTLYKLED